MVRKSTPRLTKSPSLVLIGLVLTEIQAFKNIKNLQRNVWKSGQIRTNVRIYPDFHTFLCKFSTFLNACISVKTSPINTKLGDFVNRLPVVSYPWSFRTQTFRTQAETFRTHFRSVRTQPSGRFVPKKFLHKMF